MNENDKKLMNLVFSAILADLDPSEISDEGVILLNKIIDEFKERGLVVESYFLNESQLGDEFDKFHLEAGNNIDDVIMDTVEKKYIEPNPILAKFLVEYK